MTKPSKADLMIYKTLLKAIEQDKLRLYFDYVKLNRPGSKVYNPWEALLPVLIPSIIGLLLIMASDIIVGLIFIIVTVLASTYYFRKKIYHHLIERTKALIVSGYDNMEELWKFGGIVLVNADNKKLGCVAPEGDWKDFVVNNYAEYMIEKKEPAKEEKKHDQPVRSAPRRRRGSSNVDHVDKQY